MHESCSDFAIARFRNETTHQLTTFDLARKSKTVQIPRGQRVSLPTVAGQGHIAQLWISMLFAKGFRIEFTQAC